MDRGVMDAEFETSTIADIAVFLYSEDESLVLHQLYDADEPRWNDLATLTHVG